MIVVNVGRSWPKAQSERERVDAIESGWPVRGANLPPSSEDPDPQTISAFGGTRNRAMLEDLTRIARASDFIVAVSSNIVVDVRAIDHWEVFDDRLGFKTSALDWRNALVGQRLPDDLAWRRGENWPVKVADSTWLAESVRTESVSVGPYTVHLLPNGHLHVALPASGGLVTVGAHDQPHPTSTSSRSPVLDPEAQYLNDLDEEKAQIRAWRERQTNGKRPGGSS